MPSRNTDPKMPSNLPLVAVICTTVLLAIGMVAATVTKSEKSMEQIIGLLLSTIPSFAALWYAERASRDIRNGVLTEKSRQGTTQALEDAGVTEVVEKTLRGQTSIVALEALAALLADREDRVAERERSRNKHDQAYADYIEDQLPKGDHRADRDA